MRFFLIKSLSTAGGTERVTTMLANILSEKGYNVTIITLFSGEQFFVTHKNVRILSLNKSSEGNIYTLLPHNITVLHNLFKREKTDVCVSVCSAMSLISIPASFFSKVKIITWEHFNANVDWNRITTPLSRKMSAMFSEKVIVLTSTDKLNYEKKYSASNVMCIHNPVTIDCGDARALLTNKIVLAIGRLEPQKGFDILLETWALCNCRKDGWILKIVGDGSMKSELQEQIIRLGLKDEVFLEAPDKDVVSLYLNASIYVMSSRFEGLPLVLIEAMSIGLPIISFDCETGPREIIENGKTGILVENGNKTALAETIDSLSSNREKLMEFGDNSIKSSRRFNADTIINQWINLFDAL